MPFIVSTRARLVYLIFLIISFHSLLYAKIDLHFKIDDDYLVIHTLTSRRFSSERDKEAILTFKNEVWEKYETAYRLLLNAYYELNHPSAAQELIASAKMLDSFQPIFHQTLNYKNSCESQWSETYEIASKHITNLTGLEFEEAIFEVFITHPGLCNGHNLGHHQLAWGTTGSFEYFDIVYIWHEILHSYFPEDPISHCLIQFITDNGLRVHLNEQQPLLPLIGHTHLSPLMEMIYPKWEEYMKRSQRDIFALLEELRSDVSLSKLAESIEGYETI